jgi:hypothetical protein
MNQFYANIPRDGAGLLGSALQQGASQVGAIGSQLGSAYGNFNNANNAGRQGAISQVGDMMDRTGLMTPEAQQQMRFRMQDAQNARNAQMYQQKYAPAPQYRPPAPSTGNAYFDKINKMMGY